MNFKINKNKKNKLLKDQKNLIMSYSFDASTSLLDAREDVTDSGEDFFLKALNSVHSILFFFSFLRIFNIPSKK